MIFIKLTDSEVNTTIHLNIASICAIYAYKYENTTIALNDGKSYWVLEEPEKVLEMIDNAIYEYNWK